MRQETKTKKSRNCLRDLDLPYFMRNFLTGGAEGGTRTPTVLRPSAPQAGASANSATSAREEVVSHQFSVVSSSAAGPNPCSGEVSLITATALSTSSPEPARARLRGHRWLRASRAPTRALTWRRVLQDRPERPLVAQIARVMDVTTKITAKHPGDFCQQWSPSRAARRPPG